MLNYTIVVEDGGELKSVTANEIDGWTTIHTGANVRPGVRLGEVLDAALNAILDARAIAAGEYDPTDNDTPFIVISGDSPDVE